MDSRSRYDLVKGYELALIDRQIQANPETYQDYIWKGLAQIKEATRMVR
jgi:hypothetical protein